MTKPTPWSLSVRALVDRLVLGSSFSSHQSRIEEPPPLDATAQRTRNTATETRFTSLRPPRERLLLDIRKVGTKNLVADALSPLVLTTLVRTIEMSLRCLQIILLVSLDLPAEELSVALLDR